MGASLRQRVRERAGDRCEYCGLRREQSPFARLQIEHIRARQHGGDDDPENLALACIDCNLRKGPNLAGIDPESGSMTPLFHPRTDRWDDHFQWNGIRIEGKTGKGRATIAVLALNHEDRLEVRLAWR
jgi:5-methylcytosine-specific restriction endonuclease McrA